MSDLIKRLERLFVSLCNDEWEHLQGITIENLDNPGWEIRVGLIGTPFEQLDIDLGLIERSEHDWIHIRTEREGHEKFLRCACGPENLSEGLEKLLDLLDQPA